MNQAMTASSVESSADQDAIRILIDRWVQATIAGDLDTVMQSYTQDIVAFDAIGPIQCRGVDAYRAHWELCLSFMPEGGDMIMEAHHLNIAQEGSLAFAHYLCRCGATDKEGKEQAGWMRATVCCRKTPDGWRIVHEHYSAPFDPETLKINDKLDG